MKFLLDNIDALIFDFDGVLTNNFVHLDQNGLELVSCSRADGLAFDVLCKINKPTYILSTEKNPVVTARANKLNVPVLQGVKSKADKLRALSNEQGFKFENLLYVGNDLNDYRVMQLCGYTICPADSHEKIKKLASITLETKGGNGVVREILENVFGLDFLEILYPE